MNLRRLRYFATVAEELHFGRAAEHLHMAQPPLSQQIRVLERELGVTLFERSTRRVALTDAGRSLQAEARPLLTAADAATRRMDEHRAGHAGTLRLGFVDSAAYEVMPALIREYRRRWPRVDYELRSMSSDEQHQALLAGEIDLGIGRTAGRGDVQSVTIQDERLYLAVSAGHALSNQRTTSLRRLQDEVLIGFDRHVSRTLYADLTALFASAGVAYDPIIEATEYTTILGLVAAGEGVAVVPASVRSFQPPALRFIPIRDRAARVSLMLLARRGERLQLVVRALELVDKTFRADPASSREPHH